MAIWTVPVQAEDPSAAAKAAPAASKNVPESELTELDQTFRPSGRASSRQEAIALLAKQMHKVLQAGEALEKKYPDAENIYEVQQRMLKAVDFLARYQPSDKDKTQRMAISKRILATKAPAKVKVTPDYFVTLEKVAPADGEIAKNAEKLIKAYIGRYAKTDVEAIALVRGSQLAEKAKLDKLADELLTRLEKDYADEPQIRSYLKYKGRGPTYKGKEFKAELTLTDGSKLDLPKDYLGKVVVVDFWATWCGPCRAYLPHMKKVYNDYKDKDVAFLGISLDKAGQKQKLIDFTKENAMPWPQSYSGKFWQDPTARKYGVDAIPAIWVIGKDGKVFSDTARSDLAGTIDKALAEKTPEK